MKETISIMKENNNNARPGIRERVEETNHRIFIEMVSKLFCHEMPDFRARQGIQVKRFEMY